MELYGTIGPACETIETLTRMFRAGMTGIRLNASHSSLEEAKEWIAHIHAAAKLAGRTPQLLIDLQGPEQRIGNFAQQPEGIMLQEGETVCLGISSDEPIIPISRELFPYIASGQIILLDDGKILLTAEDIQKERIRCTVCRGGLLQPKKSIALPGIEVDHPTLSLEDRTNISLAAKYGVTGVMLPFVRGSRDLDCLRAALKENGLDTVKIYAKIENQAGMEALDEIIAGADMVVIARGDLGNAVPLWELPRVQKIIARKCRQKNRDFMVVTQMLASMERSKVPTRAEVSDIYNAVCDGASAVMLTGETAAGSYPAEAMEYMVKTVKEAERQKVCFPAGIDDDAGVPKGGTKPAGTVSILCYGDSNTYGYSPLDGLRYPADIRWTGRLGKLLGEGYRVIEEGCNGRTTIFEDPSEEWKRGLDYLKPCLNTHKPIDIVILMLGSNDLKEVFHASAKEIAEGAGVLVDVIQTFTKEKQGFIPEIILVSPPELGAGIAKSPFGVSFQEDAVARSKEFPEQYRRIAEQKGCIFLNAAEYIRSSEADCLHLMPQAHAILAEKLAELIRQSCISHPRQSLR